MHITGGSKQLIFNYSASALVGSGETKLANLTSKSLNNGLFIFFANLLWQPFTRQHKYFIWQCNQTIRSTHQNNECTNRLTNIFKTIVIYVYIYILKKIAFCFVFIKVIQCIRAFIINSKFVNQLLLSLLQLLHDFLKA